MQQPVYREEKPDQASKTHADSSQTYSYSISDKEFSRPDHRKRHEAAHSYSLTCGVCGQYFNRLDILALHRAQHERPKAKQRLPMKRPAASEPGTISKQRRTVLPPRTPMGILLDQTCCQRTQRPEPSIDSIGSPFGQRKRPAIVSMSGAILPCMR